MTKTPLMLLLIAVTLVIVSAEPSARPEELVRQGNASFARAEYDGALQLYELAEERSPDPGLVAFNEGAALYRAGRYREAELHYRRALEGDTGARHARALYNLANCLLRQAAGGDVKGLAEALGYYEECLVYPHAEPALRDNAAHNLELARLLWQQARQAAKDSPSAKDPEGNDSSAGDKQDRRTQGGDPAAADTRPERGDRAIGNPEADGNQTPIETAQDTPGKGNLRPLPDRDVLAPLAQEDTNAYLEQAARRILRDLREYRQSAAPANPNVKDW